MNFVIIINCCFQPLRDSLSEYSITWLIAIYLIIYISRPPVRSFIAQPRPLSFMRSPRRCRVLPRVRPPHRRAATVLYVISFLFSKKSSHASHDGRTRFMNNKTITISNSNINKNALSPEFPTSFHAFHPFDTAKIRLFF